MHDFLFETFFNMVKVFTAWYVVKLRENFSITFTKISINSEDNYVYKKVKDAFGRYV